METEPPPGTSRQRPLTLFSYLEERMASLNSISDTTPSPDRARESVKALVAVPLGVVVPMPEGGDE